MMITDERVTTISKDKIITIDDVNNTIVFTHNDLDGIGAGQIFANLGVPTQAIEICNYGSNEIKDHLIEIMGKEVYITDFSVKTIEEFDNMITMHPTKIVWLDHHISVIPLAKKIIEKYPNMIQKGKIILDVDVYRSGALLAYDHMDGESSFGVVAKLIDDHDRWIHQYDSLYLNQAMVDSCQLYVDSPVMKSLVEDPDALNRMIELGKKLFEIQKTKFDLINKNFGYDTEFEGYKMRVIESYGNSTVFGDDINKYPICALLKRKPSKDYSFSLYTSREDIDVAAICEKYHGGGHKKAAGGHSITRPF